MTLPVGESIDDFTFQKPDGGEKRLSDFRGKALVVIFLRHLA